MTTLKSLLSTLEHAREALQFAKPTHDHYPEPVKRHAQALAEVNMAIAQLNDMSVVLNRIIAEKTAGEGQK